MSGAPRPALLTNEMAERYALRQWLKPEAEELARMVLHGIMPEETAGLHMRMNAARHAGKARLSIDSAAFAAEVLDEAMARHENAALAAGDAVRAATAERKKAANGGTFTAIRAAALAVLRAGGSLTEAADAGAAIARAASPRPPPSILTRALRAARKAAGS